MIYLRNTDQQDALSLSLLFYFNNLSSTCFEYSNHSSSAGSYCICSLWYLSCICVD